MNVNEAAELLGVHPSHVYRLVKGGRIGHARVDGRIVLSRSDVEGYRAGRRPPGRPRESRGYTLMNGPYEVASFTYSERRGDPFAITEVMDADRAPLFRLAPGARGRSRSFGAWWGRRGIPATRQGIEVALATLGVGAPEGLHFKNNALSLSDQYWIRPDGSDLRWEDVNYFDNDFAAEDIEGNRSVDWLAGVGSDSPDNAANGACPKRWVIRAGKRCLVKGPMRNSRLEPVNEVVATALHSRILEPADFVAYGLDHARDAEVCVCENFLTRDEEYIPMWHAMEGVEVAGDEALHGLYERMLNHLAYCGVDGREAVRALSKMVVCDYILANEDRHLGNFGLVRNIHTLGVRMAPLFDSGNSLWHTALTPEAVGWAKGMERARPFDENPLVQMIACARDLSWLDLGALDGFGDEARGILEGSLACGRERAEAVGRALDERVDLARRVLGR